MSFLSKFLKPNTAQEVALQPCPDLSLYHFSTCPFCRAVRRQIERLNLDIEQRNIHSDLSFRDELLSQGGKKTVPCLRIEQDDGAVTWLYESMDIIEYLQQRFGSPQSK